MVKPFESVNLHQIVQSRPLPAGEETIPIPVVNSPLSMDLSLLAIADPPITDEGWFPRRESVMLRAHGSEALRGRGLLDASPKARGRISQARKVGGDCC